MRPILEGFPHIGENGFQLTRLFSGLRDLRSYFVHPLKQKAGGPIAYFEDVGERVRYRDLHCHHQFPPFAFATRQAAPAAGPYTRVI